MDFGLNDKTALVLASSKGLGRAVAEALAAEGARVIVTGRDAAALDETVAGIRAAGGRADRLLADLTDPATPDRLAQEARALAGRIDILVNNTGGPAPGTAAAIEPATLLAQTQAMVASVIRLTGLLLPDMEAAGWGRVLVLASSGVEQPIPNLAMSNTLRGALVGWSKTLANEVAAEGITVNMLLPGRIHTDRVDQLDAAAAKRQGKEIDEIRAASRQTIPAGRYGRPEEFAAVATFLCSGPASYVTGSKIRCDGGAIRHI